jgi:hypothetical protein
VREEVEVAQVERHVGAFEDVFPRRGAGVELVTELRELMPARRFADIDELTGAGRVGQEQSGLFEAFAHRGDLDREATAR